jgi:hypothetical protein
MLKIKLVKYEKLKSMLPSLFNDLMHNTIIVVDAKLSPEEEAKLIQETMSLINEKFPGIELGSIALAQIKDTSINKLKERFAEFLLGRKMGITIIGPAKIVKRIERHPEELLVYF